MPNPRSRWLPHLLLEAQPTRGAPDVLLVWTTSFIVQVDPWGGIAVFCDELEIALLTEGPRAEGPRAWLAFRGRLIGTVIVGIA